MIPLSPISLATIHPFPGLTDRNLKDHHRLYAGYVHAFNDLIDRLSRLKSAAGRYGSADLQSTKLDLTFALSAIKNHELYFSSFHADESQPNEALTELIKRDFGSVPSYINDLRQTALTSRGWAWTAYDLDHQHLFNYAAGAGQSMPVWNAYPLLAIDMYGHAYLYDFGQSPAPYVEALLTHLDWDAIGTRLERAEALSQTALIRT
jgi:Fe-Mn family superoxide dismutase